MVNDIMNALQNKIWERNLKMKKLVAMVLCLAVIMGTASCSSTTETSRKNRRDESSTEETKKKRETESEETESETEEQTTHDNDTNIVYSGDQVKFSTTDRNGQQYDESLFADYELVMINFWEPWCGPCVGEIPDLQELYANYKDKDFLIIGVYSETTMESEVDQILSDSNVDYLILRYTSEFDKFQSGYVPTTIIVDKNGNVINTGESYQGVDESLIVGSRSYSDWEAIITRYLK